MLAKILNENVQSDSGTTSGAITPNQDGGSIAELWVVEFITATTGKIIGIDIGQVHSFSDLTSAMEPDNPANPGNSYFSIPADFFASIWATGEYFTFETTIKDDSVLEIEVPASKQLILEGNVDVTTDDFYLVLLVDSVFDPDTDITYGDVVSNEITIPTNYTAGGILLTKNLAIYISNGIVIQEFNRVNFVPDTEFVARYIAIVDNTIGATQNDHPILKMFDMESDITFESMIGIDFTPISFSY